MHRRILLAFAALFALAGARHRATLPPPPVLTDGPTFSNEIVRIFQEHCQTCHHPGDIGPFSLMSYSTAKPYATQIRLKTQMHEMPPWKPTDGCGDFADKRGLTQGEIDLIAKWVSIGAPEGDRSRLPQPLDFSSGWALGQPDAVLQYSEPYTPPATSDIYRCFPLPTGLTSDQYVSAVDVHPGDRSMVHHVIAFVDTTGESERLDAEDPQPGYTCFGGPGFTITNVNATSLGGWAPGFRPTTLPDNVALSLPANSRVVLQVHYHPHSEAPLPDQTAIGLYYANKKPEKLLRYLPIINNLFTIPPGDSNYQVKATFPFVLPYNLHAWQVAPHMHLLGKKMKVEATLPNGQTTCLINIDDWDFNWQAAYRFKEPVALPIGTRLSLTAYYDNSADNPRNPNAPPKPVSWGEQTTDEMCLAFLGVTIDSEDLTR
jgi:hypothetical protein